MGVNPATFLKRCGSIITGDGFKREIAGIDINTLRDDAGVILDGSTEPSREALETSFDGAVVSSSQTDLGRLVFKIPRDYDQTLDYLRVRFLANSDGDTDTPTIDGKLYRKREGVALSSDLDPTISAAVNTNTVIAGWVEVNCDGLGMQPGDAVCMEFVTSAHGANALNVYSLEVIYKSDLVYFDIDDRN